MVGISIRRYLKNADANRMSITDLRFRSVLKIRLWEYIKMAIVCTLLIWTGLSLFYGAMHKKSQLVNNINLYIVDLDKGSVGSNITKMVLDSEITSSLPLWLQNHYLHSLDDVKSWVLRNGWGALVINKGISEKLDNALNNGTEYNATDAITLIESTGRHVITEMRFVQPALINMAQNITRNYAIQQIQRINNTQINPNANYMAMVHPISYTTIDVAPAGFSLAPIMSTFGYLVILLSIVPLLLIMKLTLSSLFLRVRYRDLAIMWPVIIFAYALMFSLYLSLAFMAFRGPNYNTLALPYTPGTFFKLWFTGTLVHFGLGLWIFNWFLYLPPRLLAFASVTTVLPNVASCVIPPELAPKFFRFMYALPFFNGSNIILYVTTGAHSTIGRNIGILVAEIVAMAFIMSLSIWICQFCVQCGIVDGTGWHRGSIFFSSPIPYYKDIESDNNIDQHKQNTGIIADKTRTQFVNQNYTPTSGSTIYNHDHRISSQIEIIDDDKNNMSLTEGNLGV
ncbi:hypothetical protein COEREDRAFT_98588 [Coemansia reversa NRRL 1564]|uniref:DUF3533 domain-containing protein n=1 Tax=Coemansia reversa (strain ATCC 12441 / NRRL 1564) TaxID=763665 RepID=A0A2G5B763_COERN|nr:hypothetical protein COEREDRAFT_98588 [Coemansia reversa NRRL 1564]|eukprot:PIA14840.1 hypothetical protein COEREDRAFT_98588 [Coemansia reversa NRRL 1564]